MIRIATVDTTRAIEAEADAAGLRYATLMDSAGRATAQRAAAMLFGLDQPKVTVLVGAGNNGGDGLVAARYIAQARPDSLVRCYLLTRREDSDAEFQAAQQTGLFFAYAEDDRDHRVLRNMVASADLVVDALFGIGVRLPIQDDAAKVLRSANQAINDRRTYRAEERTVMPGHPAASGQGRLPFVLAVDCPSGLNCDTGALDRNAIAADETITFISVKPGLLTFPGANAVGRLSVATLGVPDQLPAMHAVRHGLVDAEYVRSLLPQRPPESNKGTFGKALIVAGSLNYIGAAGLAAKAAYRAGAGVVTVGAPGPVVNALAGTILEATWLLLPHDMGVLADSAAPTIAEQSSTYSALLLGPGWGQEKTTQDLLVAVLERSSSSAQRKPRRTLGFGAGSADLDSTTEAEAPLPSLVLDADALNLLAKIPQWWQMLPEGTVITPHPGEMARLSSLDIPTIQANRVAIAQEKAAEWNVVVLLKGAHTVIADPTGRLVVLPFKNDALATAGTGDVLAGLIVGLVAQGSSAFDAAVAGGYIHGLAGEWAAKQTGHGRSVIATDVLEHISLALQSIDAV